MRKIIKKPLSLKLEDATAFSGALATIGAGVSTYIQDSSSVAITGSTLVAAITAYAVTRIYSVKHPEIEAKYTRALIKNYKEDLREYAESVEENYNKNMMKIEEMKQKRTQERDKELNEIMHEFEKIKELQRKKALKRKKYSFKK